MPRRTTLRPFPPVPGEITERIMYYSLHVGNETHDSLQEDDISGHWIDLRQRQSSFRKTFLFVSKCIYITAMKLLWRCLTFTTDSDMSACRTIMARGPILAGDVDLSILCRRIEVRIDGMWNTEVLTDILERTSNLQVFILRAQGGTTDAGTYDAPSKICHALVEHTPMLRRIQLECLTGAPSIGHVKTLLTTLKNLRTLHVDCVCPISSEEDTACLQTPIPNLVTLSIGSVHRDSCFKEYQYQPRMHRLLTCLKSPNAFPSLRSVVVQRSPDNISHFLDIYGTQLCGLTCSASDSWGTRDDGGDQHILNYCPAVNHLACIASEGPFLLNPIRGIEPTNNVARITLIMVQRAERRGYSTEYTVRRALRAFSEETFPALRELIIVPWRYAKPFNNTRWLRSAKRELTKRGVGLHIRTYDD